MADKSAPDADPTAPDAAWRRLLLATLVVYALVQMLFITATPLQVLTLRDNLPQVGAPEERRLLVGLGPDEKEHFLYVLSLAERGALPAPSPRYRTSPEQYVSYQAQHPPLFYALAAVFYKAVRGAGDANAWFLLRGLCALFGGFVVYFAARAGREAFPDRPLVALGTGPFVAFLPMFGHMTGNLSNEPLAMALGAFAWWRTVRLIRAAGPVPLRDAVVLGLAVGLACLTRLTAVIWVAPALIALASARDRGGLRAMGVFLAVVAALLLPWVTRNQIAFGTPVLRTFDRPLLDRGSLADFFGGGIVPAEFPVPVTFGFSALWYAATAWWPHWLVQFYLPAPQLVQAALLALDVVALLLLVLNAKRTREQGGGVAGSGSGGSGGGSRTVLWAAGSAVALCIAALVQQQLFSDWNVVLSAGRYIVAAVPASALLFLFALSTLHRGAGPRPLWPTVLVAAGMLAFDVTGTTLVRRFYADNPTQPEVQPIAEATAEDVP
ncbi:MAG TPA: glycosyltransferase family 39 protein [Armatimonadaceae bacterium]|nr:glycosyltransferase family 39 protein [Armatimonadaceae bacterium]